MSRLFAGIIVLSKTHRGNVSEVECPHPQNIEKIRIVRQQSRFVQEKSSAFLAIGSMIKLTNFCTGFLSPGKGILMNRLTQMEIPITNEKHEN